MKLPLYVTGALALSLLAASAAVCAEAPAIHVRGTVSSTAGDKVTIATARGAVAVTLTAATKFAAVTPGNIADIVPGTFIGTANVPGEGAARALEVVVFPKALAGTGEGDYPWDLPAPGGHSSMTNGTVAEPRGSSMTNATVAHVEGDAVKTVMLSYKGGTKKVTIEPGTPIVRIGPGSRDLLVTGAHVVAFPPNDAVSRIVIGKDGAIPPM
jgi:hypothetical protein